MAELGGTEGVMSWTESLPVEDRGDTVAVIKRLHQASWSIGDVPPRGGGVAGWSGSCWDGAGLRQVHAVGQGAWRCASEEGPGAVLSRSNGGVLPVGWERKPWPRAGRNRSWMIHTPRVRAADLYRDQGRRAGLQIVPQSSASIANCCTKLALTSLSPS